MKVFQITIDVVVPDHIEINDAQCNQLCDALESDEGLDTLTEAIKQRILALIPGSYEAEVRVS